MRLHPRNLAQAVALIKAEKLFRKIFFDARFMYEEAVAEGDKNPFRARWSKEDIMALCKWFYPDDWRMLRHVLETKIGLIMLRQGAGNAFRGETVKLWTFATCAEDRERGVANSIAIQLGQMKRAARVTSLALAPADEVHALDENSKKRIDELLEKHNVKLDDALKTLQTIKQDLLDRDAMKLLAAYGE